MVAANDGAEDGGTVKRKRGRPPKTAENQGPRRPVVRIHPLWGAAPVARVQVVKIRYRGGHANNPPAKLSLPSHDPWDVLDPSSLLEVYGQGGRFQLTPKSADGQLAAASVIFDVPDADGALDLLAPMGDTAAPTGAAATGEASMLGLYRDIAARAEESRKNDFQAFIQLMGGASSGSGATASLLQTELATARSRVAELEGKVERLSVEAFEMRLRLARRDKSSEEPDFFAALALAGAEKFGLVPAGLMPGRSSGAVKSGAAPAAAAGPVVDDAKLPTADEFRELVKHSANGAAIPRPIVARMVALHKARALPEDLWAIVAPVAEHMELV